jgi:cob(I)alamin adenosyltransferase
MAIYTKTGDRGKTKVFDRETGQLTKISKTSCKIASIGVIDELNSFLGIVKSFSTDSKLQKQVEEIQGNLFTINSILAGSRLRFTKAKTRTLEKQIDKWEGGLPVQKNFIYYGGSQESSLLFFARGLCRRAERCLVSFSHKQYTNPEILIYMNRLSDYLFMLARAQNFKSDQKEKAWRR